MFENLSDRLDSVFKKLKGHGTLNEKNIEDGLKQVRMALLEADVNYRVAKKCHFRYKDPGTGTGGHGQPDPGPAGHQDRV